MQNVDFERERITVDDADFKEFCSHFQEITAAGGLVQNREGKYLLIYRHDLWDLPKGKQEPGEDIVTCALREVSEETGLNDLTAGSLICVTHHCYIFQNVSCIKHTWWYRMKSQASQELVPQAEEQIEQAVWVARQNLPPKLANTYPSIREVFLKAYNG